MDFSGNLFPSFCHKKDFEFILSFRSFTVIIFVNNSYNRYVKPLFSLGQYLIAHGW